jgi:DNA-binding IclR family transcriptional regulator
MKATTKLPAQPVKGLLDGIEVLYELAASTGPVSCHALAEKLGIEVTRVNRILKTFDHLGVAHRNAARKYEPGPAIHVLAVRAMVGSGLLRRALPVLETLGERRLLVALGVLWRDGVSYLYHGNPGMPSREALGRVTLFPATRSSIGMVLLAAKAEAEVTALYRGKAIPGHANFAALRRELATTRRRGYAQVMNDQDQFSLAVAVGEPAYAGIALSGITRAKSIPEHVAALHAAAEAIRPGKTP